MQMRDKKRKPSLLYGIDLTGLVSAPFLGAIFCMVLSPLYLFSRRIRIAIDGDGANGTFSTVLFIWLGAILWIVLLLVGGMILISELAHE